MKSKLICLLFLAMTAGMYGQVKKTATAKKTTTTKKAVKKAPAKAQSPDGIFATFETTKGRIVVQLEYKKTPITVANFISLAEGTNTAVNPKYAGKPFYNGLKFHRVIADFMIQGGDPLGNGSGDPGYKFKDEFDPSLKHSSAGILSMANSGPATNGSQFFITHKETSWLDGKHTVFGHVTSGMDVVNAIAQEDVIMEVKISRKGEDAKKFDAAKIFADYYGNKAEDDKKIIAAEAERKQKQLEEQAEAKKVYAAKYGPEMAKKVAEFAKAKAQSTKTESGLEYKLTKGKGTKPADGTTVYVHYAGYFEDGSLFDSSYEEVSKSLGKFDEMRASQNGYQPFPFEIGNKGGLIPGFLEGINLMSFGDKATLFIPSKLGYGERGAGNIIPPNSNIIFEVELLQAMPEHK
ncbi:peptidylprolyl isomerase [uncultured Flavobacterium sp.]|uniref:peptidylprolyl isomerase n=1 Tax=uncultured Flavobacterium sp. TaxID=165435 RepID=UPI0025E6BDB9|nr:peptidylprolyl isomerase [uncultured Flavobacterium sp.]